MEMSASHLRKSPSFDSLIALTPEDIAKIFNSEDIERRWNAWAPRLSELCQVDRAKTGAVNPGDRRALFYLVCGFRPRNVLEIGTHVGASTVHIAAALADDPRPERCRLVTIDIEDANDSVGSVWRKAGLPMSPRQMIEGLHASISAEFVIARSAEFFERWKDKFDLIFLDGDHSADTVLDELITAPNSINQDGLIVLHDFFPDGRPLWSDGAVVPGPFAATERLRSSGGRVNVMPLGRLPWPTKLNSNVTSLAVVAR
jgi:predicted O-methyltransferase YrrM